MKISKTAVLALGGVFMAAGLGLMFVSADEAVKHLKIDMDNAVQHFYNVRFISSGATDSVVDMTRVGGEDPLIRIDANNFVITQTGSAERNVISAGYRNSILGGIKNVIGGSSDNVILGGSGNKTASQSDVILGGVSNIVAGSYSDILGGSGNKTNNHYAVIIGGSDNEVTSQYSVAVGKNIHVLKKGTSNVGNSIALGSNATVEADKSFLWSDGTSVTLGVDNLFAVKGASGMVVNANAAHSFAKLTIGGSLVITNKNQALACNPAMKGILKLKKESGKTCFCSCDGSAWNSVIGGGVCMGICNDDRSKAKCNYGADLNISCNVGDNGSYVYTVENGCERGNIVEGTGGLLVDEGNKMRWTCLEANGDSTGCVSPFEVQTCNVAVPTVACDYSNSNPYHCVLGTTPLDGVDIEVLNTGEDASKYWWTCKYGASSEDCVKNKQSCPSTTFTSGGCSYPIASAVNGGVQTVNTNTSGKSGSIKATCDNGTFKYSNWSCTSTSCSSTTFTSGGCSYPIASAVNGGVQTVNTNTSGKSGSIKATCDNGTFKYSNWSCTSTSCSSTTFTSGGCSYPIASAVNGGVQTVNTNTSGKSGSIKATCDNGTFKYSNWSCASTSCPSTTFTSGGCSYPIASAVNGGVQTVNTNTSGKSGSIKATCDNGTFKYSNWSCASTSCSSTTFTSGGCSYPIASAVNGGVQTVNTNTSGKSGSIKATCDNGTFKYSNWSCTSTSCSSTTFTSGGCSYPIASAVNGGVQTVNTNTSGKSGSIKATCDNGTFKYSNWSCTSTSCPSTTFTSGGCSYPIASAVNGGVQTVNTNTSGKSGSIKATCDNGTFKYSNWSCTSTSCPSTTFTSGGCSYPIASAVNGGVQTVNTNTAGKSGSIKATCDNGTFKYSNWSCTSTSCPSTTFTSGGCSYPIASAVNGGVQTVNTNTAGKSGSIKATCDNGTFKYSNWSCTSTSCPSTTFTSGGCSYPIASAVNGGVQTVNTNTAGKSGSVKATCNNGTFKYSNWSCTSIPNSETCDGTKPTGDGVVANSSNNIIYYNGVVVGFTGWTYISDWHSVNSVGCAWSCGDGYKKASDGDYCIPNALECAGGNEVPGEIGLGYMYNDTPSLEKHTWTYISVNTNINYYDDPYQDPYTQIHNTPCSWTCARGYELGSDGECHLVSACGRMYGDGQIYFEGVLQSPLCIYGWKLGTTTPKVHWDKHGWQCEPNFKWTCVQQGTSRSENCEQSLGAVYIQASVGYPAYSSEQYHFGFNNYFSTSYNPMFGDTSSIRINMGYSAAPGAYGEPTNFTWMNNLRGGRKYGTKNVSAVGNPANYQYIDQWVYKIHYFSYDPWYIDVSEYMGWSYPSYEVISTRYPGDNSYFSEFQCALPREIPIINDTSSHTAY